MFLLESLKKTPEAIQTLPLALRYKKERWEAMQELKIRYPQKEYYREFEQTTPFEHQEFLSALLHIVNRIGKKILNYHIISDDMSGRVPARVLIEWQKRVEEKYPQLSTRQPGETEADYILGGWRFAKNIHLLRKFIEENRELYLQRIPLLVTDNIESGSSLTRLFPEFDKQDIRVDTVILSHYKPLQTYKDILQGRVVYHGEILPREFREISAGAAVIRNYHLTGLAASPDDPPALYAGEIKEEYRRRYLEALVQKQTTDFAARLPIPKAK